MKKKFHSNESYKHNLTKMLVKNWINHNPALINLKEVIKIKIEEKFCSCGIIDFVPDLTIYDRFGVSAFVEVFHKHELTDWKIEKIESFCRSHSWTNIQLYEIDSEWAVSQIKEPKQLKIKKAYVII